VKNHDFTPKIQKYFSYIVAVSFIGGGKSEYPAGADPGGGAPGAPPPLELENI
jgi:hypothetical protein